MKRYFALILAALMLASVLCACSGTATITDEPYSGYGNVSTTDDGTVNGTNDYMNGTNRSYDGAAYGSSSGNVRSSTGRTSDSGMGNSGTGSSSTGSRSGMTRGTVNGSSTGYGSGSVAASEQ